MCINAQEPADRTPGTRKQEEETRMHEDLRKAINHCDSC